MAIISVFGKLAHAAHRGVWWGVVWALMAGSGLAATALQPWDGTDASVNLLEAGEYSISSTEDQEYVLTTNGNEVAASVVVTITNATTTVTLRLKKVCLKKNDVALLLKGAGTLRVLAEEGASVLRRYQNNGGTVYIANAGTIVFDGTEGASLWVFTHGDGSRANSAISTNIGANFAYGTIRVEGGELHVVAAGAKGGDPGTRIPPIIEARQIDIVGGRLFAGVYFSSKSEFVASDLEGEWPSVLKAIEKLSFSGGILRPEQKAKALPSQDENFAKGELPSQPITADKVVTALGGSSYRYPEASFGAVQAVAMGGQVGGKAFLRVQTEGTVSAEALAKHIVSGTTGASPAAEAVSVDTERGVVAVDVTACPEPKFVFAEEKMAGAVELFGCIPTVTEGGVRVDYDFGIFGIAPVRVEGEPVFRVAVRAAVRLPQETAQSKTFKLVVTRTLDDSEKEVIFEGAASFARCSKADTLYETAPLLTSDTFSGACGIYRYRVTASKAE